MKKVLRRSPSAKEYTSLIREDDKIQDDDTVPGDVENPASDGDSTSEAKDLIKVESGNLCIVALIVGEVEMVGKSLLTPRESHWLEESLASIFIFYYQFQLSPSLLLRYS